MQSHSNSTFQIRDRTQLNFWNSQSHSNLDLNLKIPCQVGSAHVFLGQEMNLAVQSEPTCFDQDATLPIEFAQPN